MRRCTRCVLTEGHADIFFNKEGVCNYCLEFEKETPNWQPAEDREQAFIEILQAAKGKGEYDCLMMLSGGKDSTYALYILKERYKLNVLAFTFDNGFESDAALNNIRRAVDALEVDHLYFRPTHVKLLFRFLLENRAPPFWCTLCKGAMNSTAWKIAKKLGIDLVVLGNTPGQENPKPLHPDAYDFFKTYVGLIARQKELRPYLQLYLNRDLFGSAKMAKGGVRFVSPYYYIKKDSDKALDILQRRLNWKAPKMDYPSGATNCLMNLVNVYISHAKYGFSFYDTEMSTLIRRGEMTRDEALQALDVEIDSAVVNSILARMDLSLADLDYS